MRGTAPMVVSVAEAAAALGVCTDAVYTLVRTGELRAARVGRRWLIPRSELAAWLDRAAGIDRLSETAARRFDETFDAVWGVGRKA